MLIANLETCKFVDRRSLASWVKSGFHVLNPIRHPLGHRYQKVVDLIIGAFDYEFNSPIRQIAHIAGHVEATSQRAGRVPKADSLNLARVNDLPTLKR